MFRNLRSLQSARIAFLMLALTCLSASAQMNAPDSTSSNLQESAQSKIARALSAGPPNVTKNATVAEMDAQGQMKVLRLGTNDFTCLPGDPNVNSECKQILIVDQPPQTDNFRSLLHALPVGANFCEYGINIWVPGTASRRRRHQSW